MRPRHPRSRRRDPIHLLIEQLERREVVSETLSALAAGAAFAATVPPVARLDVPAGRRPSHTQSATTPAAAGPSWAVSLSQPAQVAAAGRSRAVEPLPSVAAAPWSDPFADDAWADETPMARPRPSADEPDEPRRGGGDAATQFTLAAAASQVAAPPALPAIAPIPLPVAGATAAAPAATVASAPGAAAPAARVPAAALGVVGEAVVRDDEDGGPTPYSPLDTIGGNYNYVPASLTYDSYVIDANKGVVLSEAVINHDYCGWDGDLRAQVIGAQVKTYEWTIDDNLATSIEGQDEYNLRFTWNSFSATTETSITLTVTFVDDTIQTQVFHFAVAGTNSPARSAESPTSFATWPEVVTPDIARADAAAVAGPHHAVDLVDGSVWAAVELPAYNPGVAPVRLVYNSLAADPRPTFLTRYEIDPGGAVPATVDARLTVNGTPVTTYVYDTANTIPGDFVQIALQANATGLATGRYSYSVAVKANYGSPVTSTFPGSFNVVNDAASPFGAGWWVDGVDRIVTAGDGVVLVSAGGRSLYFNNGAVEGSYFSPAGDFSTLMSDGSSWTRTLRDGTVVNFNSSGQQVSVVDRNDNRTTYAYSSGRLSTITDPNNLTTTFAYDGSSKLATVTDPASRTTTFTVASGKLTGVVDPEGGTWTYAYDGDKRLTRIDQPRMQTTTIAYSTTIAYDADDHRAESVTQADGAVEEIVPLHRVGFPTGGTTQAVLTAAATADFTDGNGHTWARRLDWAGYGRTTQLTDPEDGVGVMYRNADGLAWLDSDPNGNRTDYDYSGDGDVLQVTWANDARELYDYDAYGNVESHANPINHRTTYAYDGSGNLTSIQNALDELTTLSYDGDGNLVRTVTPRAPFGYDEIAYATTLVQYHSVAMDADGDTMMVWQETGPDGSGYGIYARRYTRFGVDLGPAFRVNSHTTGDQVRPVVALDEEGDFVVAWPGYGPSGLGVYARRYNAAGTAQGNEALVATVSTMDQVAVAANAPGDFVVAWTDTGVDGSGYAVRARLYDDQGDDVTDPFTVNTWLTGDQNYPRAAIDADGNFVVVWQSTGQDGDSTGVYARRFDYEGEYRDQYEFKVNSTTTGGQSRPTVAMDVSGNFVVAWHGAGDGDTNGIFSQRFNAGGTGQGAEFRVNAYTTGNQTLEAVAADAAGNFVVAWYGVGADDGDGGVYGRRFDEAGTALSGDFRVNAYTTGIQGYEAVAVDADGDFVITWMGADGSLGNGMYARRYGVTADTRYAYDNRDRVTTVTDAEGGVTTFGYDTAGNATTVTDPRNHTTTYTFSTAKMRLNAVTLPDDDGNGSNNPVWEYGYYADGLLKTQTDPDDKTTTMSYDGVGRLSAVTRPLGLTTAYDYDDAGNLKTMSDPLSRVTTFSYDDANRMVQVLAPNIGGGVLTTAYDYDFGGRPVKMTDPNNLRTTFGYTKRDQPDFTQQPNGLTIEYDYCLCGCLDGYVLLLPHESDSATWEYDLDDLGRVIQVTDPLDHFTTIVYDPAGNVAEVRDGLGHSTFYEYDGLNRLKRTTNALGHATEYDYDAAGNRTAQTDALGHAQVLTFDAQNRVKTSADGNGDATTFAYDLVGRLLSVTDAETNVTTYHYDAASRMVKTTDPNGETTTYSYTAADELEYVIDREGRRREFTYDGQSRVRTEVWKTGGGTVVYTATYTYDRYRLESAEDNASEYNYGYNATTGDLETVDNVGSAGLPEVELEYGFDAYGLLHSVTDNLGGEVHYGYDGALRLETLELEDTNLDTYAYALATLTNDAADRLHYVSRSEGDAETLNTTFSYDNANRLTSILHESSEAGTLSHFTYAYDAADRLTRYDGFEGVKTYTYDNADQLTGVAHATTPETFTYDDTGNRTAVGTYTYATGTGNRLLSDGVYSYSYDKEGNTTAKWKSGERWEYKWDHRNRLTEVKELTGVGGTVVYEADYTYDVFDRRIGILEDEDGTGGSAAEQTWTVYERDNAWADFDGDDELTARYLNGLGMDERYARVRADGSVAWYLGDNLGSVRQVVETGGTVLNTLTYSGFGTPTETNASDGDRFKYTGREWDAGSGQYYYRARYYGADVGRFRSEDPIEFAAGDSNLYRYVGNRAVGFVDPTGLQVIVRLMPEDIIKNSDRGVPSPGGGGGVGGDFFDSPPLPGPEDQRPPDPNRQENEHVTRWRRMVEDIKRAIESAKNKIRALRQDISKLEAEREAKIRELNGYTRVQIFFCSFPGPNPYEQLQKDIAELDKKLADLRARLDALLKELESLFDDLESARTNLHNALLNGNFPLPPRGPFM